MIETEKIVFVDKNGRPTGETGPKLASHTAHTKLHLGFSCYIFKGGKLLVTQRAHVKKVWPDVWTNSVCGHPAPGESMENAIRRRAAFELGIQDLKSLRCVLPKYTYTTPPYNGIIENEFCPVFVAETDQEPTPNPDEVDACQWLTWDEYAELLHDPDQNVSYWAKDQFKHLKQLEMFA